jgi:hypothetical protein
MVITAVSYSSEKCLHCRFIWRDGSDEEYIIIADWWCKLAVMMDYHHRLVRQSGSYSYQLRCSYEPMVILSSPTIYITNRWWYSFNDIGGDRGVGDRSICSSESLIINQHTWAHLNHVFTISHLLSALSTPTRRDGSKAKEKGKTHPTKSQWKAKDGSFGMSKLDP